MENIIILELKNILKIKTINILGMVGSLRKHSYNRAALRAAQGLTSEGAALTIFELNDLAKNSQYFVIFFTLCVLSH